MTSKAICILFSESYGASPNELAAERTLATVPFAGRYRLIDFVLSSLVKARIYARNESHPPHFVGDHAQIAESIVSEGCDINGKLWYTVLFSGVTVEEGAELNSAVVSAKDLFPQGSVTLYGIKTFGEQRIDEAILDAASVACEAQSILSDVFLQVIAGKTEMLREAESLLYEDSMGVSAWVGNKRVLIGNRELMLNHGVDVPSRDYEVRYLDEGKELIYLSSGGELSGVFVVGLSADPQIRAALKKQEMNDIFLTVKCVDPILNHDKLGEIFDVEPAMFKIMPARLQEVYQRETRPEDWISSPVANNGSFYSYVSALVCAKRLKGAAMIGMVLQLASIVAGYALLSVFGVLGDFSQLTTLSLAAYQGIWFVLSVIGSRMRNL